MKKEGIQIIICGKSKTNPCHSTGWLGPDSSTQITSFATFILKKQFLCKGCGRDEMLSIYCQIYIYIRWPFPLFNLHTIAMLCFQLKHTLC